MNRTQKRLSGALMDQADDHLQVLRGVFQKLWNKHQLQSIVQTYQPALLLLRGIVVFRAVRDVHPGIPGRSARALSRAGG